MPDWAGEGTGSLSSMIQSALPAVSPLVLSNSAFFSAAAGETSQLAMALDLRGAADGYHVVDVRAVAGSRVWAQTSFSGIRACRASLFWVRAKECTGARP